MSEQEPRGVQPPENNEKHPNHTEGLTRGAQNPYPRSAMPEDNAETPRGEPQEAESTSSKDADRIITKRSDAIENPLLREYAKEFEKDINKNPHENPFKDWSTNKLIAEYRKLHGVKSRIAAMLGFGKREQETAYADSLPYTQLLLGELARRGVDIEGLIEQTHELVEQQGQKSLLRKLLPVSGGSDDESEHPARGDEDEQPSEFPEAEKAAEEYIRKRRIRDPIIQQSIRDHARATGHNPFEEERANQEATRGDPQQQERAGQRREREEGKIHNLNEFLLEIIDNSDKSIWGIGGQYPLLKEVGQTPEGESKYEIVQENILRWVRDRMVFFHGESPNEDFNFFQKVRLQRYYRDISVIDMLENQERYFRDVEGNQYTELADQIRREVWQFSYWRNADIEYKLLMGEDTKIADVIAKRFYLNDATRTTWKKSGFAHTLSMPQGFDSTPKPAGQREIPKQPEFDTNVGMAVNTALLSYYYLSDYKKLSELLGNDAPLLSRQAIIDQIDELAQTAGVSKDHFIEDELAMKLLDTSQEFHNEDLIRFINIFNHPEKPGRIIEVVRELIKKSIQQKFERESAGKITFGTIEANYAELSAFTMSRLVGAGWRNDTEGYSYDAGTKPGKLKTYRMRQARPERGGAFGNPYSIHMLKSVMVDFLSGTRTETFVKGPDGKPLRDNRDKLHNYSPLDIMELMEQAGLDIDKQDKVREYIRALIFPENTQRNYANNHVRTAFGIFHDITEGTEINWSKFVTTDPIGGVRFNRAEFEKEVKENFFKKMRYNLATYGQLDFSKKVRVQVEKDKWEDQPLAQSMFGHEVLDVEEFWKKDYRRDQEGYILTKNGKRLIDDPRGEPVVLHTYEHVIDYNEVNANKAKLWKMEALGRLAAELYAHKDYHSTDPRYNPYFYMQVIDALERIPANVAGDEFDLKSARQSGRFFSKEEIDWLRHKSNNEQWRLYSLMVLSDVFKGSIKGFRDGIKLYFRAIIEQ